MAKLIKKLPGYRKGQPIRLLSCNTGSSILNFAQNLANKMNIIVYAPNNLLWAYPSKKYVIVPRDSVGKNPDLSRKGKFVKFKPGGNVK